MGINPYEKFRERIDPSLLQPPETVAVKNHFVSPSCNSLNPSYAQYSINPEISKSKLQQSSDESKKPRSVYSRKIKVPEKALLSTL